MIQAFDRRSLSWFTRLIYTPLCLADSLSSAVNFHFSVCTQTRSYTMYTPLGINKVLSFLTLAAVHIPLCPTQVTPMCGKHCNNPTILKVMLCYDCKKRSNESMGVVYYGILKKRPLRVLATLCFVHVTFRLNSREQWWLVSQLFLASGDVWRQTSIIDRKGFATRT